MNENLVHSNMKQFVQCSYVGGKVTIELKWRNVNKCSLAFSDTTWILIFLQTTVDQSEMVISPFVESDFERVVKSNFFLEA